MSNHSLTARGTDPPFSQKSVVSITHEQNIICSKTLICSQLFAGHVVGSRPMKRKEKIDRMINGIIGVALIFMELASHYLNPFSFLLMACKFFSLLR